MPEQENVSSDAAFTSLREIALADGPSSAREPLPEAGKTVLGLAKPRLASVPTAEDLPPDNAEAPPASDSRTQYSLRESTEEPKPAQARAKRQSRVDAGGTPAQQLERGAPVDAPVHLSRELRDRLRQDLGEEGLTIGERVVLAFNRQYENFDTLFGRPASTVLGPMPARRSTRRRRGTAGDPVLVRMALSVEQLEVLQAAIQKYDSNRSLFVSRLLDADLPPLEPPTD